jgi:DNA-binding GntR family transcriptional regulator
MTSSPACATASVAVAMIPDRRSGDSLGAQATVLLRDEILAGRFPPGSRLNELRLANELALSRGPIREALRGLEREGLVVSLPNRGSFVSRVTPDYMAEIFDLREIVEPAAAHKAFARRSHGLAGPLLEVVRDMREAAETGTLGTTSALHARFHGVIYHEASGRLWGELWDRIEVPLRIYLQGLTWTQETVTEHVERHAQLAEVLIGGDAGAVDAAILEHLAQARAQLPFPFSGAASLNGSHAPDPSTH